MANLIQSDSLGEIVTLHRAMNRLCTHSCVKPISWRNTDDTSGA